MESAPAPEADDVMDVLREAAGLSAPEPVVVAVTSAIRYPELAADDPIVPLLGIPEANLTADQLQTVFDGGRPAVTTFGGATTDLGNLGARG